MTPKELVGALVVEAAEARMLEVVETSAFAKDAGGILAEDELAELHQVLGTFRQLGSVIKGTGGLRKVRWSAGGKGKRGGARIIYYYGGDHMPIFLLAIYAKSEKADMAPAEKRAAAKLVDDLQREYRRFAAPAQRVGPRSTRM